MIRSLLTFVFFTLAIPQLQAEPKTFSVVNAIALARTDHIGVNTVRMGCSEAKPKSSCRPGIALVTKRGDLARNETRYSLLRFDLADIARYINAGADGPMPVPQSLLEFTTGSSEQAFRFLTWFPKSNTLMFLGTRKEDGDISQVYSYETRTRALQRITDLPRSISAYTVTPDGQHFLVMSDVVPDWHDRAGGYVFTTERDLRELWTAPEEFPTLQMFSIDLSARSVVPIENRNGVLPTRYRGKPRMFIAPSGKHAVRLTAVQSIPPGWFDKYGKVRELFGAHGWTAQDGVHSAAGIALSQFELIDMKSGTVEVIGDAPGASFAGPVVAWTPNESSVVVAGLYRADETLNGRGNAENGWVAEMALDSGHVTWIAPVSGQETLEFRSDVVLAVIRTDPSANGAKRVTTYFKKVGGQWVRLSSFAALIAPKTDEDSIKVSASRGVADPDDIVATDVRTRRSRKITTLNPKLNDFALGKVENFRWMDALGRSWTGGLLLPSNLKPGHRYSLVIQTYGYDESTPFLLDQGMTAQPGRLFLSRDILVLQLDCTGAKEDMDSEVGEEGSFKVCIEGAIEELRKLDFIDVTHLGIVGFSRLGHDVLSSVTFSPNSFAAAVIADSIQPTLWGYLLLYGTYPGMLEFDDPQGFGRAPVTGAQFVGDGIRRWEARSPTFHIDSIRTPILYEHHGRDYLCACLETYVLLKRAQKPVELMQYPQGLHNLERPVEQFNSRQSILDWFAFWLNGEERTEPQMDTPESATSLHERYRRWRALRQLQGSQQTAQHVLQQ